MAVYNVTAPDGTKLRLEGPEGATPEQIGAAARAAYAARSQTTGATKFEQARESYARYGGAPAAPVGAEPSYVTPRPGTPTGLPEGAGQVVSETPREETTAMGLLGAVSRGAAPAAYGALGGGALGGVVGGLAAGPAGIIPGAKLGAELGGGAMTLGQLAVAPLVDVANRALGTNIQQPAQALEAFLTQAGVPEPKTAAERIVQMTVSSAAAAGAGAQAGGAVARGTTSPLAREVATGLAAEQVAQTVSGAASGAAAGAAQELGLGYGGQLVASIIGGAAGSRAARTAIVPASQAQAAERAIVAEGERIGVPVMTSDIAPPRTFMGKAAQAAGERVPLVGTGPVRAEQQAARIEAVRDIAREFGATTVAEASEEVMKQLSAERSGKLNQLTRAKNDVINSLAPAGAMPVTRTTAAIDQQIAKLKSLKTKEVEPVIKRLEDWRQSVQGQDIGNIELLRKQLGESFKAPELANVRSTGEKALSSIYGAIRDDMGEFIKANGQPKDFDKWSVANKQLATMMGEVNKTTLKSVLARGEATPEVVARMIFSEKPSEMRVLYRNLNDKGKEAAKTAVVARALEKASVGEDVSPEKFRAQLDKLGPQIGVFFKGDDLQRVKGLERVLSATRRAADAGVMTSTGQQAVPAATALAAGQVSGSALGGAALLGAAGLVARLYESAPVRNLLLKLPTVKAGTPEEAALIKRIVAAAQTRPTKKTEEPTE